MVRRGTIPRRAVRPQSHQHRPARPGPGVHRLARRRQRRVAGGLARRLRRLRAPVLPLGAGQRPAPDLFPFRQAPAAVRRQPGRGPRGQPGGRVRVLHHPDPRRDRGGGRGRVLRLRQHVGPVARAHQRPHARQLLRPDLPVSLHPQHHRLPRPAAELPLVPRQLAHRADHADPGRRVQPATASSTCTRARCSTATPRPCTCCTPGKATSSGR